jgi:hypothetical protein
MKRMLVVLGMVALFTGNAWAESNGVGCGPGAQLMKGNRGVSSNTIAMTLDLLLAPTNMFAMSSGTSGCRRDSVIKREQEQTIFVAVNLDALQSEMARGQGEHLMALAALMGCPFELSGGFARMSQEKFEALTAVSDARGPAMLASLKVEMRGDALFAHSCTRLS